MRKISLLLLFILCTGTLPISASNFLSVNMNFNNDPQREIAQFETFYGSTLTNISGYDGKAAELANFSGDFAAARLTFGAPSLNTLTVAQTIRIAKSKEAQIRLLADGKHIAIISFAQSEVKALGSDGWIRLRSYTADSWYRVQIRVDTTSKYYEVMIDGIKLGGAIPCVGEFIKADSVQYSVQGADSIFLFDDLSIFEEQQAETHLSNSESTASASRRAYYGTYQPRYDLYQAPHEDVIAGERVTGEITASSTAEGFSPDAVMDGNVSTKWQAAPAAKPIDYGKSLMLNKTGATDGTQLAAFNFAPVKGTLVIEEDVLAADVFGEKAIPYVFSSNGNMSATMLMNGDRFLIAGTANDYRDLSSDTWYHLKMELNTETQTYNVYVNNEVWIQNVPFRSHCPDFSKIQFHMGGNSYGTFCVDNLKIYTVSPLGYFKELILEDNFEKYEEGTTSLNSWNISPSTMGEVSIQRYGVQSEYKFTQTLNIDVERESDFEGAYLVIPDGISIKYSLEISRKNGYYLPVSDKTDRFYSGEQIVYYSPVRSRHLRLTIYDAIDTLGNTVHAQLSEMKVVLKHREPVANIAFAAKTEVSGSASSDYDKRGINDNIVAEFGNIGEWWSGSEPDKWVELTWDTPQTVDRVILHDSASLTDHTKSGVLSFDDGSTI